MQRAEALALVQQVVPGGHWYGKGASVRGSITNPMGPYVRCSHLIITYPCSNPHPTRDRGLVPELRRPVETRTCWRVKASDWHVSAEGATFREALQALVGLVLDQNKRSLEAWAALGGAL